MIIIFGTVSVVVLGFIAFAIIYCANEERKSFNRLIDWADNASRERVSPQEQQMRLHGQRGEGG